MDVKRIALPESLGFREGTTSAHTSRTMMLGDLSLVLSIVERTAKSDAYQATIVDENILGKSTHTTRLRTAKRLAELYGLDPTCVLFRLLRHFWDKEEDGRPMLAFLVAATRDPLLRDATPFIVAQPMAADVNANQIGEHLAQKFPGRYRPTTLHSVSQNLASSWTQAGYLAGKVRKRRDRPIVTPAVAAFAVLLGYLCGLRGKLLLESPWTRLLDRPVSEVAGLAIEASKQGWLNYKAAGQIVEITFPGLLSPQEEKAAHEQDRLAPHELSTNLRSSLGSQRRRAAARLDGHVRQGG